MPGVPPAPGVFARETEAGEGLAGMMRARLTLMPPQVAADYRALACRDDLTVAERAKLSVLEDTYAPSSQQLQAAIEAVLADGEAQSPRRPAGGSRPEVRSSRS